MRRSARFMLLTGTVVGLAALAAIWSTVAFRDGGMRLSASLPNAFGIEAGLAVQLNGFDVGKVTKLELRGDKAFMEMKIDKGKLPEPLHEGTTLEVRWTSVLGTRQVVLTPGPTKNPLLPDGAVIEEGSPQVLVAELLEALDGPTRANLQGTLKQLDTTLQGSQGDFNRTAMDAGPTVRALGAVLNGVGADGEAIKTLMTNLHKITEVLAARKENVSSSILDLNRMTSAAAVHQRALADGLKELPSTLDTVKTALDKIPAATDATVPLLEDLRPAADRLPGVSHNLNDVLKDLTPALHDLPPVLADATRVLHRGPKFFDVANGTLDQLATTLKPDHAGNAVRFLRPYTPEIMGAAGNWGSTFSGYDAAGYFTHVLLTVSDKAAEPEPKVANNLPIGPALERHVPPGASSNQPWTDANAWDTDANGDGPR